MCTKIYIVGKIDYGFYRYSRNTLFDDNVVQNFMTDIDKVAIHAN